MREGSTPPTARELLAHPNITFWGDLDIAGMQIYERIGRHVPAITLSALYGPMVEALTVNDLRHSYVAAVGKSGQLMFSATREDSRKRLCSVDKMNVLECTQLWRDVMIEISKDYPDVELSHMLVDNAARLFSSSSASASVRVEVVSMLAI